ncbi:YrdB family protein [Micromonospora sp. ATA32]|nr:YrdB family protein [Micromonospora sp. ATA32]
MRPGGTLARFALGLGIPLVAATLWGLFAAPRAPFSVPALVVVVKVAVFGSAAIALWAIGHRWLAVTFAVLVAVIRQPPFGIRVEVRG